MSLLLDALKTRESSAPSSAEPNEEALDGREALKILTANMPAGPSLTLEASPSGATVTDTAAAPDPGAVPRESDAASRDAPIRQTATSAMRPGLAPKFSPATPLAATPARKFAAMLALAVAVVIVVMVGKSLLHKNSQIVYPDTADSSPAAAAPSATRSNLSAVQVPSRPVSQFSGVGGAPEIDLHEDAVRPTAMRVPLRRVEKAIESDAPATQLGPANPDPARPRGSLSVTPSAGVASIDAHIESGYRALASGDLATAQREYRAALDLDPNNVDALLGTASAAARAGNPTLAVAAYARVLKVEPGNKDATAALAILNRDPATEANESRLKLMIAGDSERRPALHAALAAVYAADRRWADAAQEYFIALSMDPGDAEVAFNLAASLDQNHNAAAALTYYAQTLALAKQRAAQIDVQAVQARISQLQARIEVRPATARAAP